MEKTIFNNYILNDDNPKGKKLNCYTWIYRMAEPNEFQIDIQIDTIESAKKALQFKEDEKKRYLMNIVDNHPYITVYHKAGPS